MKQCRECGTFSTDETMFCSVCGKKFPEGLDVVSDNVGTQFQKTESRFLVVETSDTTHPEIIPLLQRIIIFLEDGEFDRADDYCERVLDIEPMNAEAYINKLLIEFKCNTRGQLKNCLSTITNSKNYAKVIRFGNERQKAFLEDVETTIQSRLLQHTKQVEQESLAGKEHQPQERLEEMEDQVVEQGEINEYYIDIYCPFCHEELSYINWQIEEGGLICPVCNGKFEFSEGIRR